MANEIIYQNVTGQTVNGVAPGGQTTSSDNNQALADQGFAWIGPAGGNTGSGSGVNSGGGIGGSDYDPYKFMTLEEARAKADATFAGMQSPMSLELIKQRELEAQNLGRQTAGTIYDPKIKESERLGKGEVSTVKGVTGQSQGFNISTAEATYLNNTQKEVQSRTKEIVDTKATYIANGDFEAAKRADDQIKALQEYENQLIMAKANYALSLMSGDREKAGAVLAEQRFAFDRETTKTELGFKLAELTGEYDGSPTFAAKQASIDNALREANLTGVYNGAETLDARIQNAQLALQKEGLELDWAKFKETVRSNQVQESLSRARLAQTAAEKEKTPGAYMDATIERLKTLRDAGQLTDANYLAELNVLGTTFGYDVNDTVNRKNLESAVNKAMEGDTQAINELSNVSINDSGVKRQKEWYEKHPLSNLGTILKYSGEAGLNFFGL